MVKFPHFFRITEEHNGKVVIYEVTIKLKVGQENRSGYARAVKKVQAIDEAVCDALCINRSLEGKDRFSRNGFADKVKKKSPWEILAAILGYYKEKLQQIKGEKQ